MHFLSVAQWVEQEPLHGEGPNTLAGKPSRWFESIQKDQVVRERPFSGLALSAYTPHVLGNLVVEAGVLQNERSHDRKNAKPWELLPDSIRRAYMRVVSGVRLAFQAGTGEFEPLRPLQYVLGRFPTRGRILCS